jgi:checkpoint serine/threonine-protein kinase
MRTSRSSIRGETTFSLQLGDAHFQVYEKLGEGGFGAVFAAKAVEAKAEGGDDDDEDEDDEEDDESRRVAIKVVQPGNAWEFQMLRKVHASLPAPLRSSVIYPHALHTFDDESFLVLDLCTQGSLLDIINRAGAAGVSQQGACLDELLVVFFTVELLRLLEGLHGAGLVHGDLKIDNCLVRLEDVAPASAWAAQYDPTGAGGWHSKGIKLIDFGRTIDTRMFPPGQTFVAEWATDARDCVEMRDGRPWTYQADYFGLAGIVYCMLYGKYIEASSVVPVAQQDRANGPRYKLATAFKRYWQTDLWTRLFDVLLNPCSVRPDGVLPISDTLAPLRAEMETWLQANCNRSSNTLKGLLKKIELSVIRGD